MPVSWLQLLGEWELNHWTWPTAHPRPPGITARQDIHLIRGTSSRALRPEIVFGEKVGETTHVYREYDDKLKTAPNTLVKLRFAPRLNQVVASGTTIDGLGINVDTTTGVVTAVKPAPTGRLVRNFLLDAIATFDRGTPTNDDLSITIRVHIYDQLVDAWLTPSPLTVHRGSNQIRPTLLASFSITGEPPPPLVGDITRMPGIVWSAGDPSVAFGSLGEITATTLGTFPITATLPAAWGSKAMQGSVVVVDGWHEKPDIAATLIAGPGSARLDEVPNVLVVSEGFAANQKDDWNTLVVEAFDDMRKQQINRPFDLFLTDNSINIWSLFIASREQAASALYEVTPTVLDGVQIGSPAGYATTASKTGPLQVSSLITVVGLPTRSDTPPAGSTIGSPSFRTSSPSGPRSMVRLTRCGCSSRCGSRWAIRASI